VPAGSKSRRTVDRVDRPRFALERFEWSAPDRLELAGTFSGIADASAADPVLTVHGPDGPRRLPAYGDGAGPATDGERWTAAFAWLEPPVAFDRARLELGPALAVELPGPGEAEEGRFLPVEHMQDRNGDEPAPDAGAEAGAEADVAVTQLRLEAQLLDAQQQLEEARVDAQRAQNELERTREELERTREDLAAEREREAVDAVRYREGLAGVRESAEQALAAGALARSRAEQEAQSEIDALRERVADLEPAAAEIEATRAELAEARGALADARAGAQILLDGLDRYVDPATAER